MDRNGIVISILSISLIVLMIFGAMIPLQSAVDQPSIQYHERMSEGITDTAVSFGEFSGVGFAAEDSGYITCAEYKMTYRISQNKWFIDRNTDGSYVPYTELSGPVIKIGYTDNRLLYVNGVQMPTTSDPTSVTLSDVTFVGSSATYLTVDITDSQPLISMIVIILVVILFVIVAYLVIKIYNEDI